jgi:hypothetical protein
MQNRDNSVGIALGYGMDVRGSRVRFLSDGTMDSYPGGKAAGE